VQWRRWDSRVGADASLSSGVLGVRLLALAAVAGAAVLLPPEQIHGWRLILGVAAGAALALLQHLAIRSRSSVPLFPLSLPQAGLWALLIHATGGHSSPFVLGYLLEPPLAGLLFGSTGLVAAATSVAFFSLNFPEIFPSSGRGLAIALWLVLLAAFTVASGGLVLAVRRRREFADRRQRALQEEMSLLVESLSGGLLSIDERGRIESLNLSATRMLSAGTAVMGKPWQEVLQVDADARDRILESLVTGTVQRALPLTLECSGRERIAMRAEIWPSPGFGARRTYLLLEAEASENREDPVRQLGEAAACVAHQIKNSVHALQGMVPVDGTGNEYQEGLRSLGALAEDVLAFSGRARPDVQPLAIQDAVRAARVLLGNAPIRVCAPEVPLCVMAHRGQLVHAIFNLLDNARRVTPPGASVEVRARAEDGRVTLEILDRGPGIASGLAAARQPVASAEGTGLGLVAARRWVETNGGSLTIGAAEGGGTLCRLALPLAACERPAPPALEEELPVPARSAT
jgi:signal transduction histidine kinase